MKRPFLLAASALLALSGLRAQEPGRSVEGPSDIGSRPAPNDDTVLTFSDDFTGPKLDTAKWNTWVPWPVIINGEKGAYLPDAFEFLAGGGIRIRADRRPYGEQPFTTGELCTAGKFSQAYGYWEMVARVPRGNGFWPAFWIMPSETAKNGGAEIDVMEILSQDTKTVHLTLHYNGIVSNRQLALGETAGGTDFADGYHTYAVSWRPQALVWLVDGKEKYRIEGNLVPSAPEYLIANLAVGGSWPKPVDDQTPFPACMDIKSIRVYQYKDLLQTSATVPRLTVGATAATPAVARPGAAVDIRSSFTTATAYPTMLVRVYVTDFYGRKYLAEIDKTYENIALGAARPIEARWTVPAGLPDGIYTVALKFSCAEARFETFLGCASRLEISASGDTHYQ